jgi:hypothetical protein
MRKREGKSVSLPHETRNEKRKMKNEKDKIREKEEREKEER